jgi:hypothetical protein
MRIIEAGPGSIDVYEANQADRLRGRRLSFALKGPYSMMVGYDNASAYRFNSVLHNARWFAPGFHLLSLSVEHPDGSGADWTQLKAISRRGVILPRGLKADVINDVTEGKPIGAHLLELTDVDAEITPEELIDDADEKRFHQMYLDHRDRQSEPQTQGQDGAYTLADMPRVGLNGWMPIHIPKP